MVVFFVWEKDIVYFVRIKMTIRIKNIECEHHSDHKVFLCLKCAMKSENENRKQAQQELLNYILNDESPIWTSSFTEEIKKKFGLDQD